MSYASIYPTTQRGPVRIVGEEHDEGMDWIETVAAAVSEFRAEVNKPSASAMEWEGEGWEGGELHEATLVVIDTNYLISHLPLLKSVHRLVKATQTGITLAIPRIVLTELDGLKNSSRTSNLTNDAITVGTQARSATTWLLDVLSTRSAEMGNGKKAIIRGQRKHETAPPQDDTKESAGQDNDGFILRFAIYAALRSEKVVLLSDDKVLCLRARFEGIATISTPSGVEISAEDLLKQIDSPSPSIGGSPPARRQSTVSTALPSSPSHGRSSIHSPPPISPAPHRPAPAPLPLHSRSAMMHVDSLDVPSFTPLPPPAFSPAQSVADVFIQIDRLLTYFLALPLYRHIFLTLSAMEGSNIEKRVHWMEEVGDWREWNLVSCLDALVRWWHDGDGGLRRLCESGLAKGSAVPSGSISTQTTLPLSVRTSPLPIDTRLERLLDAIRLLKTTFALDPSKFNHFNPVRVEVVLEQVVFVIEGVFGGLTAGEQSTLGDAKALARDWIAALGRIGFAVDATPFLP